MQLLANSRPTPGPVWGREYNKYKTTRRYKPSHTEDCVTWAPRGTCDHKTRSPGNVMMNNDTTRIRASGQVSYELRGGDDRTSSEERSIMISTREIYFMLLQAEECRCPRPRFSWNHQRRYALVFIISCGWLSRIILLIDRSSSNTGNDDGADMLLIGCRKDTFSINEMVL